VKRGEVWWANLDGPRPVVLLSVNGASEIRAILIVPAAGGDITGVAVEVTLGTDEGLSSEGVVRVALPRPGRINCAWLVTLRRVDLEEHAGALSSDKLAEVEHALKLAGLAPPAGDDP
jgi:mRNA interferase MazF